jgi:alcohol dehydrogenase
MGARLVGASPIIAVDILPAKFALAQRLGADYTLAASERDPVSAVRDLTGGGVAYAFEAVGNADVLVQAFKATRPGGKTIAIGLAHPKQQAPIQALSLVALEKTLQGSFMGSSIPRRDIPLLIQLYQRGKLPIDELLSPAVTLDEINSGFDRLAQGSVVRQLVHFS